MPLSRQFSSAYVRRYLRPVVQERAHETPIYCESTCATAATDSAAMLDRGRFSDRCHDYSDGFFRRRQLSGAERDRTDDLRLAKPALSQLSYSPDHLGRGCPGS